MIIAKFYAYVYMLFYEVLLACIEELWKKQSYAIILTGSEQMFVLLKSGFL